MATTAVRKIPAGKAAQRFYRPELDILRFCAFGMVFFAHSNWGHWWSVWGILGVPVFFLLSAFLITDILLREKESTGAIHLKSFYVRRILRIWPLYFAALTVGFILLRIFNPSYPFGFEDVASYALLAGNWRAATHGYLPLGLGVLWSLTVEEQFYLVWPWMIRKLGRRQIVWLAVAIWLASQLSVWVLCDWKVAFQPGIWCNTFADLQYFALGAGFSAFLGGRIPALSRRDRYGLGMASIPLFVLPGPLLLGKHPPSIAYIFPGTLLACVGASFLFFSLFGARVPPVCAQ